MSSEPSRLAAYLCVHGIPRPDGSSRCPGPVSPAPTTPRKSCKRKGKKHKSAHVAAKKKHKCKKKHKARKKQKRR